jgi:NAD(P)-dependent dehydrogenase (short-subunit alcohol dehydrogenase family)
MAETKDFPAGTAIVVGGSGGIGRAICERLAFYGSDVALTYRGNEVAAKDAAATVEAHGRKATIHQVSVSDAQAVQALFGDVRAQHGAVHTVVHAAGSPIDQPYISQVTPDQWRSVMDADVNGFFNVVYAGLPHLRESGAGSFVYISSAGLKRFPAGDVLSVAPKGAVEALVHGIAKEEGRYGIRANSVALGVIDAGMFPRLVEKGELSAEWVSAAKKNAPLRRFGTAVEVAEAVAFLASRRASYITGQTLMLDGGYTL